MTRNTRIFTDFMLLINRLWVFNVIKLRNKSLRFSPERAQYISVGQRPTNETIPHQQALKGRHLGYALTRRCHLLFFFLLFCACHSLEAQTEPVSDTLTISDVPLLHQQDSLNMPDTLLIYKENDMALNDTLQQAIDTTATVPAKKTVVALPEGAANPHKATLWALLPGGGQIYNWNHGDKWWIATLKLTAIYGGFGTLSYFIVQNTKDYRDFRDAYKWVSTIGEDGKGTSGKENKYTTGYSADQLKSYMDYYQTNVEWCYFFTGLLYGLQIVEATVTAHLLTFDVSDNLSFSVKPLYLPNASSLAFNSAIGLSLRYKVQYK